eukprot:CAMPEP_0184024310 /NCGR_PEP_ID=MMETSP0954-20121128/11994_1 /TAXON_ID=627963 /ORGANISM="Aplanochytrium sp, Strain PBS07" /LENGTH=265 /DNA_ID=CAMNT_0026307589 /DNA_START=79 /DNA_END=877 /DNA_ORIENTATION=+
MEALLVGLLVAPILVEAKLKCFTSGVGTASNGFPCSLPFSYENSSYVEPVSFNETIPILEGDSVLILNASHDMESCSWCSTVSLYENSTRESWGVVSDCFEDPEVVSTDIDPKYTLGGCKCLKEWKVFGHPACTSYCCSPDGDSRKWCKTESETCQSGGWGYCDMDDGEESELEAIQKELALILSTNNETFWFEDSPCLALSVGVSEEKTSAPTQSPVDTPVSLPSKEPTASQSLRPTISPVEHVFPELEPPPKAVNEEENPGLV